MNEIISETKLAGKYRRRGTSVASASSVVNLTDQRPRITDQKRGTSDDLLIDHCSLDIERSACQGMTLDPVTGLYYTRNRNYDPSLGSVLRQEPKSRLSAGVAHREINQDPLQYINGANTYQFVMSDPVGAADPWGLSMIQPGQGSPFLSNPNYKPPGWNPSWPTAIDNRGPYTRNPDSGVKYYPDEKNLDSHWPHYDTDQGPKARYPRDREKPWPNQKQPPYRYQSDTNPWDDIPEGDKLIVVDGDGAAAGGSVWEIVGDDLGEWLGGPIVWAGSVIFGDTGTAR